MMLGSTCRTRMRGVGKPNEHAVARAVFPFDDVQLRSMIAAARRHGYAYNDIHVFKGMETITDMAAVGVPILSSRGTPVAALHLTAITQRLVQPRRDNVVALLRTEADAIQSTYGPVLDAMEPPAAREVRGKALLGVEAREGRKPTTPRARR